LQYNSLSQLGFPREFALSGAHCDVKAAKYPRSFIHDCFHPFFRRSSASPDEVVGNRATTVWDKTASAKRVSFGAAQDFAEELKLTFA